MARSAWHGRPVHAPHWIVLSGWILGWILLWRVPRIPRGRATGPLGAVTIVVPARNEAERLPALLEALTPGLDAQARIVVVDDHSTDATAEVARRYAGVEVVAAPELPAGWAGKAWACQVGAHAARPGELVFVDADVRLSAAALGDALAERRRRGGLLSVWPYHTVVRPYEHLSALFNVVSLMALGAGSAWPPRRMREALGPVLLTHTDDYVRIGGHGAVRDAVVEDLEIGRRYADAGLPVHVVGGDRDLTLRMYGEGLRGLVQGWMKSLGSGTLSVARLRVLGMVHWLTCGIGALSWASGLPKPLSIVLTALYVLQMGVLFRQVGSFGWLDALLYPFHVVFVAGVLLVGLFRAHVLRRVAWRGRAYAGARAPGADAPPPG